MGTRVLRNAIFFGKRAPVCTQKTDRAQKSARREKHLAFFVMCDFPSATQQTRTAPYRKKAVPVLRDRKVCEIPHTREGIPRTRIRTRLISGNHPGDQLFCQMHCCRFAELSVKIADFFVAPLPLGSRESAVVGEKRRSRVDQTSVQSPHIPLAHGGQTFFFLSPLGRVCPPAFFGFCMLFRFSLLCCFETLFQSRSPLSCTVCHALPKYEKKSHAWLFF